MSCRGIHEGTNNCGVCNHVRPFPRAVYAGSFDPITNGHLDIIKRAVALFGGCSVLAAVNPDKTYLFSSEEKLTLVARAVIQGGVEKTKVAVFNTSEYVADWCAREIGPNALLVRGIRDASELPNELAIARFNKARGLDTVILPADEELSAVSSSALKRLVGIFVKHRANPLESEPTTVESFKKYAQPAVLRAIQLKLIDPEAKI